MAADLAAAQSDLSSSLVDLRGSSGADPMLVSQSEQQLAVIMGLRGQLATASGKQLVAISAQIAVAVSAAAGIARQAQQAAASGGSAGPGALANATQAAREAANEFEDAYFKQHKFDAYLHFKSDEEEREFRRRETEREKQIEEAKANGTPEGAKEALDVSIEQLDDAAAHGADQSPDYAPLRKKVVDARTALNVQIENSKAQSARAQSTTDPLDSVEADSSGVPADLLAKFRSGGVVVADQSGTGHGVTREANSGQDLGVRYPS